jgi:ribonuclease PH
MARIDGRANDEMRPVKITLGYQDYPEGSALIEIGKTRVICAVSVEERVPPFLKGQGSGWVTAEYDRQQGRSQEIQRLIGRSLRSAVDMDSLGERTFAIDCDVLQADGGTRTASITGAYVALYVAIARLRKQGIYKVMPVRCAVAATSVGVVDRVKLLDLCYDEDFRAGVDFNVVMTDKGEFVELQGTAEGKPFSKDSIDALISLADKGIKELFEAQKKALAELR